MDESLDIVLEGFDGTTDPVEGLVRVFGVDAEMARAIVSRVPTTVKKDVPREQAEQFLVALRSIGAKVRLDAREVVAPQLELDVDDPLRPAVPIATSRLARERSQAIGNLKELPGASAPAPAVASTPPAMPSSAAMVKGPAMAPGQSRAKAEWRCRTCGKYYAEVELAVIETRPGHRMKLCPADRGPVEIDKQVARGPFVPALLGAFIYPIQKSAPVVFIGIALVAQVLSYLWIIGDLLAAGVVLGYLFTVIRRTAFGDDDLPMGQDFIDLWDLVGPVFRYIVTILIAFAPAIAVAFLFPTEPPLLYGVAIGVAVLAGLFYMPAGVIVAAHGSGCASPFAGFVIIGRIPGPYMITTIFVAVAAGIEAVLWTVATLLGELLPIPFFPGLFARIVSLFLPLVICRMLGLLILHHEDRLGL